MKTINKEINQAKLLLEKQRLNAIDSIITRLETKLAMTMERKTKKQELITGLETVLKTPVVTE